MSSVRVLRSLVLRRVAPIACAGVLLPLGRGAHLQGDQTPATIMIEPQGVYTGCNALAVRAPIGTSWTDIVPHFSDVSSLYALWLFDNAQQRYHGVYFLDPNSPTDGNGRTIDSAEVLWACVGADGTVD